MRDETHVPDVEDANSADDYDALPGERSPKRMGFFRGLLHTFGQIESTEERGCFRQVLDVIFVMVALAVVIGLYFAIFGPPAKPGLAAPPKSSAGGMWSAGEARSNGKCSYRLVSARKWRGAEDQKWHVAVGVEASNNDKELVGTCTATLKAETPSGATIDSDIFSAVSLEPHGGSRCVHEDIYLTEAGSDLPDVVLKLKIDDVSTSGTSFIGDVARSGLADLANVHTVVAELIPDGPGNDDACTAVVAKAPDVPAPEAVPAVPARPVEKPEPCSGSTRWVAQCRETTAGLSPESWCQSDLRPKYGEDLLDCRQLLGQSIDAPPWYYGTADSAAPGANEFERKRNLAQRQGIRTALEHGPKFLFRVRADDHAQMSDYDFRQHQFHLALDVERLFHQAYPSADGVAVEGIGWKADTEAAAETERWVLGRTEGFGGMHGSQPAARSIRVVIPADSDAAEQLARDTDHHAAGDWLAHVETEVIFSIGGVQKSGYQRVDGIGSDAMFGTLLKIHGIRLVLVGVGGKPDRVIYEQIGGRW